MKHEVLFSSKDKSKKKLVSSAANFYLPLKGLSVGTPLDKWKHQSYVFSANLKI